MSLLTVNSTPAELRSGCVFAENFESNEAVIENGATITGTPVINQNGATLNGTTDYITYSLEGRELNQSVLSFVIEFTPDTPSSNHYLFDSTDGQRVYLFYVAESDLKIAIGAGVYVCEANYSTWSQYVNFGKKNTIVCSATDGDTTTWINGHAIDSNNATNFTVQTPTQMFVGARYNGTYLFNGTLHSYKFFNQTLTAQDAVNFHNNSTYNYRNKAVLDLPMGMAQHDSSNVTANKLVDGDMEADNVDGWSGGSGYANTATPSKITDTPHSGTRCLRVSSSADQSVYPTPNVFTAGKKYRVTAWARGDGSVAPKIYNNGGSSLAWRGDSSTDWQQLDTIFTAGRADLQLRVAASGYCDFDDIVIEEMAERTLDVSGKGNHALLGDGATATTMPTKLTKRGYSSDGGDYMILDDPLISTSPSTVSMVVACRLNTTNLNVFAGWMDKSTSDTIAYMYCNADARFSFFSGINTSGKDARFEYNKKSAKSELLILVGVYDGTNTSIYVNGVKGTNAGSPAAPVRTANTAVSLFANTDVSYKSLTGTEMYAYQLYDFALTPLQIQDITINLKNSINNI